MYEIFLLIFLERAKILENYIEDIYHDCEWKCQVNTFYQPVGFYFTVFRLESSQLRL